MAGLYAPLPTLRRRPRGCPRTARGRCGSLLLHRSGLSPPTPCRSPGALTRVAARTLARSPIRNQLHRRLQPFRYLHDCSGCFRLERLAGWDSHPLESAALSRRTRLADTGDRDAAVTFFAGLWRRWTLRTYGEGKADARSELVVEITYLLWFEDGLLRHKVFGLARRQAGERFSARSAWRSQNSLTRPAHTSPDYLSDRCPCP